MESACTLIITVGLLMQRVWKKAYEARVPHVCNATTGLYARNLGRARIPIPVQ